jgi:hypothetical protein
MVVAVGWWLLFVRSRYHRFDCTKNRPVNTSSLNWVTKTNLGTRAPKTNPIYRFSDAKKLDLFVVFVNAYPRHINIQEYANLKQQCASVIISLN